ncbi:hypothetical protein FRACYDRAFT_260614 [Fragilariopsis cylindrus CCMP1102]|uniref:PH domain-containing protein n=1 Tax=Fragilariopsis cylindrus CCMP1102 TaxID=635003 RepID=A0A1E7FMA5_9STRA|nr:hypothetical protein FRACYDRAFT_260614 [Fragilariopsis cylindrus CCMP1102]|eukprot:OEU18933.1 hypothetical protein FRACYDRAFT_260614 [Fragilariopsis cylindrus CCMP1102]
MATKQGLSAQISQASEDAKRGFLQRTSLTNSLWFSNLNTTCTIKSAPPRTPDVLGMLSVKSGWLFKRNEQHVWQARYCCVVPHTFLYYFDSHPTNPCQSPQLTSKQQEELNKVVRQGFGKRGQSQPRSSLYNVLGGNAGGGGNAQIPLPPDEAAAETYQIDDSIAASSAPVQPAGIIDMECYTSIHRNNQNELVMELAGDETVNPDLRSFYFCANTDHDGEEWTQALLGQRHSSLTDEREAYKQVCDGFAQQLQVLHTELDQTQRQADSQQDELYRVRSTMEDTRRNTLRLVSEIMTESTKDQRENNRNNSNVVPAKKAYKTDLEIIQAQNLGIFPAVQLLCDYTRVLEETCSDDRQQVSNLEEKLLSKQQVDTSKVEELEKEIERLKEESSRQQSSVQSQLNTLTQKLLQSKKECQDVQKDLASQRMEMTMYQSSTRSKMGELQSHKKILKKEVIDLRKKMEETNSELDLYRHRESSVKLKVEQERQKSKLLERYVDKIESQVKVQHNMMEMMSQAGSVYGGSVYGGAGGSQYGGAGGSQFGSPPPTSPPVVVMANGSNHSRSIEEGYKRTQKQFDAAMMMYSSNPQLRAGIAGSPRTAGSPRMGPPAIIGIAEESTGEHSAGPSSGGKKLDTIMSPPRDFSRPPSGSNLSGKDHPRSSIMQIDSPSRRSVRKDTSTDRTLNENDLPSSTSSISKSKKMTIAQKARLDADRQSTPVRIRPNQTPIRGNYSGGKGNERKPRDSSSVSSQHSRGFFSNIGKRFENVLDNSVLGVDLEDSSDDDDSRSRSTTRSVQMGSDDSSIDEEKKMQDHASEASTNVSLSLVERRALQRAQQVKFLKKQGLINKESDVKGGAGGDTNSVCSRSSHQRQSSPRIKSV